MLRDAPEIDGARPETPGGIAALKHPAALGLNNVPSLCFNQGSIVNVCQRNNVAWRILFEATTRKSRPGIICSQIDEFDRRR
jgi:hypothetical protein